MSGRLSNLLVAVGATVVGLILAEIGLRALAPVPDPYEWLKEPQEPVNQYVRSAFEPNTSLATEVEPGLPGMSGKNRFTIDNMGFRGPDLILPKPAGEYRVFLVGGSTTEGLYLDDRDSFDARTASALRAKAPQGLEVRVYGAGKSGDRSDDHVSMIVHRILHLEPDVIVVFAGINDLRASIFGYDYLHYRIGEQTRGRLGASQLLRLLAYETQLGRRLHYLLDRTRPPSRQEQLERITLRSSVRSAVAERRAAGAAPGPVTPDVDAYRRNLQTIVGAARAHGVGLVLMTQQTTWPSHEDPETEAWQWMQLGPSGTYAAADLIAGMDRLNEAVRELAREHGVPLYDLACQLPPTLEFFYDDVHFNVRGAEAAGEGLAALIASAGLLRPGPFASPPSAAPPTGPEGGRTGPCAP